MFRCSFQGQALRSLSRIVCGHQQQTQLNKMLTLIKHHRKIRMMAMKTLIFLSKLRKKKRRDWRRNNWSKTKSLGKILKISLIRVKILILLLSTMSMVSRITTNLAIMTLMTNTNLRQMPRSPFQSKKVQSLNFWSQKPGPLTTFHNQSPKKRG